MRKFDTKVQYLKYKVLRLALIHIYLPHGVANALMIDHVLRFNAAEVPVKMGTFPQYDHPHTLARYAEVCLLYTS